MKIRTIALSAIIAVLLAGCGVATLPPASGDEAYVPPTCAAGEELQPTGSEANPYVCGPADQPCPGYDVCPGDVVEPAPPAPKPKPKPPAPKPVAPAPEPAEPGC